MILSRTGIFSIAIIMLSACTTTSQPTGSDPKQIVKPVPVAKSVPVVEKDGVDGIHESDDVRDSSGLGTIVYNGQPLIKCGQQVRTGSRIRRELCNPDAFNGMYPSGGINMGTALESQIPYGNYGRN